MISHRSYQFFGYKDGQIVSIADVERGLACGCACPHCKSLLVAKKGDIICHHFAHVASTGSEVADCGYGNLSALHSIALKILLSEKHIILPGLHVSAGVIDANGREHRFSKSIPPYRLQIESVEDEVVLDGIIPDILIRSGNRELLVEIAVTSFVNNRKRNWLAHRNKAAIEIDLSGYFHAIGRQAAWDFNKLRDLIVESVVGKSWVHNPKGTVLYQKLYEQAQSEALKIKPVYAIPTNTRVPLIEQNQRESTIMEGICQLCGHFTKEDDWWSFDTATMTCKCNKCLRNISKSEIEPEHPE